MDASSLNFFVRGGVPPWRELVKTTGIIGTPLLAIHTKLLRPATYGERLQIHTSVSEWRDKGLLHRRVVQRGDDVLCEGSETRAFCVRNPANPDRIKAIPVPPRHSRAVHLIPVVSPPCVDQRISPFARRYALPPW